jgi:Ras-related protein Rab-18
MLQAQRTDYLMPRFVYLVYDVGRPETFKSLSMRLKEVQQFNEIDFKKMTKVLVANKTDLSAQINRDKASEWARSKGMSFVATSANTGEGVDEIFGLAVEKVVQNSCLNVTVQRQLNYAC